MSMQQIIEVERKNRYGNDLIYPVNDQAKNACAVLGGQKTLTMEDVKRFKVMGFIIRQVVQAGDKLVTVGEL